MNFIDSHAHLHDPAFDDDRDVVIERGREAGIEAVVLIGAGGGLASTHAALALAEQHDDFWVTAGVHPHDASAVSGEEWDQLAALAGDPKVVAIGETGLDYFYQHSDPETQRRRFADSIHVAKAASKPLVCHIRDAHSDAKRILRDELAAAVGGVIHCFTGTAQDARDYLDLGFHISFSGIITFKSATDIRQAAALVPPDRLLLETDCPYLAPVPKRGKRNEPAFLPLTAACVAEVAGRDLACVAEESTANTRTLFALT